VAREQARHARGDEVFGLDDARAEAFKVVLEALPAGVHDRCMCDKPIAEVARHAEPDQSNTGKRAASPPLRLDQQRGDRHERGPEHECNEEEDITGCVERNAR